MLPTWHFQKEKWLLPLRAIPVHVHPGPLHPLRKGNQLRIPRQTILADPALLEVLLHVDTSRLIEAHILPLHDAEDVGLCSLVETGARVAFHVARHVEVGAVQACFDVVAECGRERRVLVEGGREAVQPLVTGYVECCEGLLEGVVVVRGGRGREREVYVKRWRGDEDEKKKG
jgi:hypothetical protein